MIHSYKELYEHDRFVYIDKALIEKFSPDTLSITEFRNQEEIDINSKIYSNHMLIGDYLSKVWNTKIKSNEINMTVDSDLFIPNENISDWDQYSIMYEGKVFHQYYNKFDSPSYVLETKISEEKIISNYGVPMNRSYRLGIRTIGRSTDSRTLIVNINPKNIFYGNSVNSIYLDNPIALYVLAILNSYIEDYLIRQKVSANVNIFYINSLPIPLVELDSDFFKALAVRSLRLIAISTEYAELWKLVASKVDFTLFNTNEAPLSYSSKVDFSECSNEWNEECIVNGKTTNSNRLDIKDRAQLRAEIDAIIAHLYGLEYDEMSYILDTFSSLRNGDEREFGEFRSKRMVLEEMERLEECLNTYGENL